MVDAFGRRIDYLRISVTDRCNLRCVYCMPPGGIAWQPRESTLSYEEILTVVRAAVPLGITRVRLTGGEPLVRPGLVNLVRDIAAIQGIQDLSLTTNGILLAQLAAPLAEAGLRRVNISLDTLDPARFRHLTRLGDIERVWAGIHAAESAGLVPIKINTVVIRGTNDDELCDLARLTLAHPWHVRFIELMPVGNSSAWGDGFAAEGGRFLSAREMMERLSPLRLLRPEQVPAGNGPTRIFRIPGSVGTVGFISPVSEHFCSSCNRLRLIANGQLRPCLFSDEEIDLRSALRAGATRDELCALIRCAVARKPAGHHLAEHPVPLERAMAQIGG